MTQQDTATDRLVSIIQLIQLGRRTGVLRVKRGEGGAIEEGMIMFANGQVVQSYTGRYSGSEAMNRLSAWQTCRFTFTPSDMPTDDTLPSSKSSKEVSSARGDQRVTGKLSGSGDQFPQGPRPFTEPITPLPVGDLNSISRPLSPVPYRKVEIDVALHVLERKKLTRSHRRLLLLIDGQRPTQELARLIGQNEKETQILLKELEQALIISFHPAPPFR